MSGEKSPRAPRAHAVRVKMRVVKILRTAQITMRTAQVSMRIAQCVLQKLYGNNKFELEKLYIFEITNTFSFYHKSKRFGLPRYGEKTIILDHGSIC